MARRGQYGAEKRQKELKKKKKKLEKLEKKRLKKLGPVEEELDENGEVIVRTDEDAVEGDAKTSTDPGDVTPTVENS